MNQLIQPNYAINIKAGLCLKYSRSVFGIDAVYDPAWQAWQKVQYRHEDKNFPDASVPVWFDWWGKLPGDTVKKQYGHVAVRDKSGIIWSSPLSGIGRAWFNSIEDLVKAFGNGMKYVGWSEDINNVRVVQEEEITMPDEAAVYNQFKAFGSGNPSQEQVTYYTHQPWNVINEDLLVWNRDERVRLQKELANLAPAKYEYAGDLFNEKFYRAVK